MQVFQRNGSNQSFLLNFRAKNSIGFASAEATLSVDTTLTDKIDQIITNDTISQIAKQATDNVNRALASTKEANKKEKIDDPENLRQLFRFAANLKVSEPKWSKVELA